MKAAGRDIAAEFDVSPEIGVCPRRGDEKKKKGEERGSIGEACDRIRAARAPLMRVNFWQRLALSAIMATLAIRIQRVT